MRTGGGTAVSCMVDVSVLTESLRSLDGVDAAITHEEATLGNMLPRLRINSVSGRDGGPADRRANTGAPRRPDSAGERPERAARAL